MFWRRPPETTKPERATERANVVWWNRFKAERRDKPEDRWLKLWDPLPGILPPGVDAKQASLANDANIGQVYQGLLSGTGELGSAGLYWLGYPYLSELAQRAEYRNISQVFAEEMTREWIKFSVTGDKDKTKKIREIEEDFRTFKVQQHIRDAVMYDGLMGISHIYPNLWGKNGPVRDDLTLLNEPLVLDRRSFAKGSLRGFVRIEAIWTYPAMYNAIDPLDPLFYKPASWYVMGKTVHRSRLLTVVGRPVPDLIKPAYMFGGISMTQLSLPYIDRWLKTVGNVNRLINAFSVMVLSTNLSATLNAGGAADLDRRAEMFARYRDNFELFMTDKETEDFKNVTASIAGLSELQAQAQEHCASVARQPLVKYTGIQPAGLNACFVAGTLIETDRGHLPIEQVRKGDFVLTRKGWAPVAWAGCSGYSSDIIDIQTSECSIRCTASHPLWNPSTNEFVPAGNARHGQPLLYRGETERLSMENRLRGEVDSGGRARTDTTRRPLASMANACCIGPSGLRTWGLSRTATTSITSTTYAAITGCLIWCLLRPRNMRICTGMTTVFRKGLESLGRAVSAAMSFLPILPPEPSCAAGNAGLPTVVAHDLPPPSHVRSAPAVSVATGFRPVAKPRCIARAVAALQAKTAPPTRELTIRRIRKNGATTEKVYDITVVPGFSPEFFANGILAHNSSEGELRTFYDTMAAMQEWALREPIDTILKMVQLNRYGDIDEDIHFHFEPLWQLDSAGKAAVEKMWTDIDQQNIDMGTLSQEEVRTAMAAREESRYAGLDLHEPLPEPEPMQHDPGLSDPVATRIGRQGAESSFTKANSGI